MAINFNVDPYYDDFDPSKNYHRILYRPGRAVQARELTQTQTMLQSQISKFADGIYSQNTPITGGKVTIDNRCYYLKLNTQFNGQDITAEDFKNKVITDSTGGVLAKVIATAEATGTTVESGDPPTLIISYLSGVQFSDEQTLTTVDGSNLNATTIGTAGGTTSTGLSSVASISEGVYYIKNGYYTSQTQNDDGTFSKFAIGNFVSVQPQTAILDKYGSTPSYRIGLAIAETITDYVDDPSLLDPAVGASNYQAPGADRYEVTLTLTKFPLELGNDDQFIELVRMIDGKIVRQLDNTVYSAIDDYFAKRTYDTNGDFVVENFGLVPVSNTANSALYDIKVGKGVAYVQGYKVESYQDSILTNERSRSFESVDNNSVYVDYGSYFFVDTVKGAFDVTTAQLIDMHCVPNGAIDTTNTTTYQSTLVGTGLIRNLDYSSLTTSTNTASYVYKAFVYNLDNKAITGNVVSSTTNTVTLSANPGQLSTTNNAYYGVTLSITSGDGKGYRGIITDYNGVTKTATVSPDFSIPPTSAGSSKYALKFDSTDVESIANTTSGTTTIVKSANINTPSGKVGGVSTGDTALQNTGTEELVYKIGEDFVKDISDSTYYSTKVFRNKQFSGAGTISLAITLPVGLQNSVDFQGGVGNLSADAIRQNFTVIVTSTSNTATNGVVGTIMDWTAAGCTVNIDANKNTVTFTSTTYVTNLTVTVIAKVAISNADDTQNILRTKTLITGNTTSVSYAGPDGIISGNTFVDLTYGQVYINKAVLVSSGPQSLYVSDVKKIVKIIDTGDSGTVPTDNMLTESGFDITNNYRFNNGQKDTHYDHASISLAPGAPKPKGNILVVFDYYSHSSADGYFSVESYLNESYAQIPVYTAKNSKGYNLRDCLDFRPTRKNGIGGFDFQYSGSPSSTDAGTYIPQNLSNWLSNYSYYLARKDKIVLTKDRNFQIIKGNPSVEPILPTEPAGSLLLATITHDPYTAYLPSEAPRGIVPNLSIEKKVHRRWTMSDITGLSTRVNNIEYYTSLSLLEQRAQSLQVTDNNGLNRFKNGILVDDFSSLSVSDTNNPDFLASVDSVKKQMTASYIVNNYTLDPLFVRSTWNRPVSPRATANTMGFRTHTIGKGSYIFTLPYNSFAAITQRLASRTININPFNVAEIQGIVDLTPPMDNWVDNTREPDLLVVDPNMKLYLQSDTLNTLNVTDWKTIPGSVKSTSDVSVDVVNTRRLTTITTTTSTTTNWQESRDTTTGYWKSLGSASYANDNGYITNVRILPYIRPQELFFHGKGLKVNSRMRFWFDNINIDQYIMNPDVIELTNVSGTFELDDLIGAKDGTGKFYPIATVMGIYKYPNQNTVRLYVAGNFHTSFGAISDKTIFSALTDVNGNFTTFPASGTPTVPVLGFSSVKNNGGVVGIGTYVLDHVNNPIQLFRRALPTYTPFSQAHGVWQSASGSGDMDVSYSITIPKNSTVYLQTFTGCPADITIDGTLVAKVVAGNVATTITGTYKAPNNNNARILRIRGFGSNANLNHVAFAISTTAWKAGTLIEDITKPVVDPDNIIFCTSQIPTNYVPIGVSKNTKMYGGGSLYTAVNQIVLGPDASSVDGWYNNANVAVRSTIITKSSNTKEVYKANNATQYTKITAYDGTTRRATLQNPVDVTMGYNKALGGTVFSEYTITGTQANYKLTNNGPVALSTNENGEIFGVFNIPSETFQTGKPVFRIDNRLTEVDPESATSYAEATFTASSLKTSSQSINFSPSISAAKRTFTTTASRSRTSTSVDVLVQRIPRDPVTQSFLVEKADYPDGLFLRSVKIFFKTKSSNNIPVTLSIVGTLNGYPNGETLDNSIVTKQAFDVKVSDNPHHLDSSTYTEFVFPAPVYIQSGVLYAILLQSSSDDYNVYVAAQNDVAIASTVKQNPTDPTPTVATKIGTVPYVGNLFESQNALTWVADPTRSIMFVVEACDFVTSYNPTIQFAVPQGLPQRKSVTTNIQSFYSRSLVSGSSSLVTNIDKPVHALNITTTDLTIGTTNINYAFKPSLQSTGDLEDSTYSVVPGKFGAPTFDDIYLNDNKGPRLLVANNANSFFVYASLSSGNRYLSPILSDDGLTVYTTEWDINNLGVSNTSISLLDGGSGYDSNNESGNVTVSLSAPDIVGGEQAYAAALVSANGVIDTVYITYEGSGYLTAPTITITDANTSPGGNASVVAYDEYSASGGNARARYITKKTTLTPANESQDLRVYLSAYRPVNTQIYVYYRIQNTNDTSEFENLPWQLMTYIQNTGSAFSANMSDIKEYEFAPGTLGVPADQVSYAVDETVYTSFNQFQIKIVLTTSDKTYVPVVSDLRVLCLPSGTGI